MITYILTKYYYYKYLWTIKKSVGSLKAIAKIELNNSFLKEHKEAELLVQSIRNGTHNKSNLTVVTDITKRNPSWN